jgi:hypothetical protein
MIPGLAAFIHTFRRLAKQRDHEIQSNIANGDCFPAPILDRSAFGIAKDAAGGWSNLQHGRRNG